MKISLVLPAALLCAAFCFSGVPTYAQVQHFAGQRLAGHFYRDDGKEITGQQKSESDQLMQTGLSGLQAASSAVQAGNGQAAYADLQSAHASMVSAEPIYHGYREKAIHSSETAMKVLESGKKGELARAAAIVARSIQDATTAVSNW